MLAAKALVMATVVATFVAADDGVDVSVSPGGNSKID